MTYTASISPRNERRHGTGQNYDDGPARPIRCVLASLQVSPVPPFGTVGLRDGPPQLQ
jgi:hypothetical protein